MTNAYLAPSPKQRFFDNNGNPAVNGTLSTFAAGTTTPIATYTDNTASTPNANPITLNFRGECDLWLKPNIAYKLQLNDANGVLIWTVDQIINSQLITLYGGVDTGVANAYILTFAAPFTSYVDGTIITWIPANSNTGASNITVNGIGIVSIVNIDGNPLLPGQITANQPATIMAKGGVFELISSTLSYGTTTISWTGFSVQPSTTITYRCNQNVVSLTMPASSGTSSAVFFSLNGLPVFLRPVITQNIPCVGLVDNATNITGGAAQVSPAGSVSFFKDGSFQNTWNPAGSKGFSVNSTLTYSK